MTWTFRAILAAAERRGISARECTPYHWQVTGGPLLVNVYPTQRRIHVGGTTSGERADLTPRQIVALAFTPPPVVPLERRASRAHDKAKRSYKRRRMEAGPCYCRWCGVLLRWNTVTLDHVVPLARAGQDTHANWCLACLACNQRRGHDMPETRKDFPE